MSLLQPFLPDKINEHYNNDQTMVYWVNGAGQQEHSQLRASASCSHSGRRRAAVECVYNLLTFATSAGLGKMSDSYGRKPIIVLATVLTMAPYLSFTFAFPLYVFFAAKSVSGLFAVNTPMVFACTTAALPDVPSLLLMLAVSADVSDTTEPENRAVWYVSCSADHGYSCIRRDNLAQLVARVQ